MPSPIVEYLQLYVQGKNSDHAKVPQGNSEASLLSVPVGSRARMFSKDASAAMQGLETGSILNAKNFLDNVTNLTSTGEITPPITPEKMSKIFQHFDQMTKDLSDDPEFNTFLNDHFKSHEIVNEKDKEVIKRDIFTAYRYKVLSEAFDKALYYRKPAQTDSNRDVIEEINTKNKYVSEYLRLINVKYDEFPNNPSGCYEALREQFTVDKKRGLGVIDKAKYAFDTILSGTASKQSLATLVNDKSFKMLGDDVSTKIIVDYLNNLKPSDQKKIFTFLKENQIANTASPEAKKLFDSVQSQLITNSPNLQAKSEKKSLMEMFRESNIGKKVTSALGAIATIGGKSPDIPRQSTTPTTSTNTTVTTPTGETPMGEVKKSRTIWSAFKDGVKSLFNAVTSFVSGLRGSKPITDTTQENAPLMSGNTSPRNTDTTNQIQSTQAITQSNIAKEQSSLPNNKSETIVKQPDVSHRQDEKISKFSGLNYDTYNYTNITEKTIGEICDKIARDTENLGELTESKNASKYSAQIKQLHANITDNIYALRSKVNNFKQEKSELDHTFHQDIKPIWLDRIKEINNKAMDYMSSYKQEEKKNKWENIQKNRDGYINLEGKNSDNNIQKSLPSTQSSVQKKNLSAEFGVNNQGGKLNVESQNPTFDKTFRSNSDPTSKPEIEPTPTVSNNRRPSI